MGSRAMSGLLKSLHNITMKAGIPSTASSRPSTNRDLASNSPLANSSTLHSRDTVDSLRAMVQGRDHPHSTPSISRDRGSSTPHIAPPKVLQEPSHKGPTPMSRGSMGTISNKVALPDYWLPLVSGEQHEETVFSLHFSFSSVFFATRLLDKRQQLSLLPVYQTKVYLSCCLRFLLSIVFSFFSHSCLIVVQNVSFPLLLTQLSVQLI